MSDRKRTTKYVTGTFTAVYHGDYVPVDEIADRFDSAADSGLNDRDDLRGWNFRITEIREVDGDPEGYDR